LVNQLKLTNATLIIAHPDCIDEVGSIAERADIPLHRILLLEASNQAEGPPYPILSTLIAEFQEGDNHFVERTLKPGEGKTSVAFYFFSSGLSGLPKVTFSFTRLNRTTTSFYFCTANGNKPLCDNC
jgi:4-coumarate--CoA ligase